MGMMRNPSLSLKVKVSLVLSLGSNFPPSLVVFVSAPLRSFIIPFQCHCTSVMNYHRIGGGGWKGTKPYPVNHPQDDISSKASLSMFLSSSCKCCFSPGKENKVSSSVSTLLILRFILFLTVVVVPAGGGGTVHHHHHHDAILAYPCAL